MSAGVGDGAGCVKVGVTATVGEGVGDGTGGIKVAVGVAVGVLEGVAMAASGGVGVAVPVGVDHSQVWMGEMAQIAATQAMIPTMALIPCHLRELSI
jgi:hypothetical protein